MKIILIILLFLSTRCYPVECESPDNSFSEFFEKFRVEKEFQLLRTAYPLRVIYLSPDKSGAVPDINLQSKYKRSINGKVWWLSDVENWTEKKLRESPGYFPHVSVMSGDEEEGVNKVSDEEYLSYIGRNENNMWVVVRYRKINGCWHAYEFEDLW